MAVHLTLPLDVERTETVRSGPSGSATCTGPHAQGRVAVPSTLPNGIERTEAVRLGSSGSAIGTLRAEWQCEFGRLLHESGLIGGSCGLTPRRRCQPSSGATRAESVFPTKREGPARRCRRHAMAAEALVPSDAARVAIRIATRVATVYTNTLKWYREAIFGDLCTLLRSQGHPQPKPTSQQCTQMPQNGAERPF